MAFTLDNVVPWGRSMDEYVAMFDLAEADFQGKILGCADGPASFNAEMHSQGRTVISIDPIYQFSTDQIRGRIETTYPTVMEQLRRNVEDYVWARIPTPEALGELRVQTMERFLADYPGGKQEGRYLPHSLPHLPFDDHSFDLALCSHFLFLYSDQLSVDFHCDAIREMLRVAREVRVFSLLTLGRQPSPHLERVYEYLREIGCEHEVRVVDYEFQRGGNRVLRVW